MNLLDAKVVLRVRSVPDILDVTFPFMRRTARLYLRLGALLLLPLGALALGAHHGLGWDWPDVWALAVLCAGLLQGAFTVAAARRLFDDGATTRQILGQWARRLPSYAVSAFVRLVFLTLGSVVAFLLLPSAALRTLFMPEASLLEGAGPPTAVVRSRQLARRQYGRLAVVSLALLAAPVAFACAGELLGQAVVADVLQLGAPFGSLWKEGGSPFAVLGFLCAVPYVATARFLTYVDIRTRKEGWDIQIKLMALAAADAEDRAA